MEDSQVKKDTDRILKEANLKYTGAKKQDRDPHEGLRLETNYSEGLEETYRRLIQN